VRKRSIIQMTLVGLAVGAVLAVVAVFIPWLPDQASREAGLIDDAYWLVTIICVVVFAVVAGVSVYAVWKFRAPPGDLEDGSPIHGHTGLEIAWTVIPVALVTAIAIFSGVVLYKAEDLPENHRIVEVSAQQFAWTFTYPGVEAQEGRPLSSGELVMRVDDPVEFQITSKDVIHSFWVPEFRMKQDAVPGITTRSYVTPTQLGTFPVVCTELCGLGHSTMRARVRVLTGAQFEAWVREQRRLAAEGASVQGEELFTMGAGDAQPCGSCHTLADAGTQSEVGPELDNALQGANEEFIRTSILEPNAEIAEGFQPDVMPPNYGETLSEEQVDGLVEYLVEATGGG
jgi:cytochrome c oxidase subunit 2